MDIFNDPTLKMEFAGKLKRCHSNEISASPLGIGFETLDREMFIPEKCYDLAAATGVKWARCQTGWNRCETDKGVYDFAWLDSVVDNLLQRGIQPWFNLGYGNPLYMKDCPNAAAVGCVPTGYGEDCRNAWIKFVGAIAGHFRDRVTHWEIWNEPNLDLFWYPTRASGENYAELVAVTAPVIKAVIPQAKLSGCCSEIAIAFVQQMLQAGIGKYIDAFAVHPYATLPEQNYFTNIAALRRLFLEYAPHVKLQQGECGYPSQTYDHQDSWLTPYYASEETQAKYVLRRVVLDSMLRMERISYFHLVDLIGRTYRLADGKARPPIRLGLLRGEDYSTKPAYHAFANIAPIFDSRIRADDLYVVLNVDWVLRQTGALPFLAPIVGTFICREYPLYAYYFPEDLQRRWPGMNNVSLRILAKQDRTLPLTRPVLIDGLSGRVYNLTGRENMNEGYLYLRGLPLTDYPLMITDAAAVDFIS